MTISWTDSEIYYYDSWRMWIDAFLSTLSTSSTSSFSSSSFSENRYLSEEKWNPATNTTSMMDDPMTNGWMDPDWTFPPTSDPDGYFNINQHNNHDDHHNNGSGVGPTSITQHHRESREQILGYLLWYLFLVVCCVLPTCCAYRRRRLMGERLVQQQQANLDRLRQQNHQQQNFFVINLPYDETTTSSANVNNNNNNDQTETITEILKGTTFVSTQQISKMVSPRLMKRDLSRTHIHIHTYSLILRRSSFYPTPLPMQCPPKLRRSKPRTLSKPTIEIPSRWMMKN